MTETLDRTKYLGGSDVAAVLGVSPWLTPFMLYQKKIGEYREEITPAKQRIFDRGARWEEIVCEMLCDELTERGHDVRVLARNKRYPDPSLPYLAAEIDMELAVDGEETNVEAKTVSPFAVKQWGEDGSDNVPLYYLAQCQHGMMIKPRRRCIAAALTGFDDKPRVHWIDRDEDVIAGIRAKEIAFWQRVQDRIPPEPTTLADIMFLYKRDGGTILTANEDLEMRVEHLKSLKTQAKELEAKIELISTKVKIAMGSNATLIGQDGDVICTWRSNKDGSKTEWQKAFLDCRNKMTESFTGAGFKTDSMLGIFNTCQEIATKPTVGNRVMLVK